MYGISFPGRQILENIIGCSKKGKGFAGGDLANICITISVPGNSVCTVYSTDILKFRQTFACLFCAAVNYIWLKAF